MKKQIFNRSTHERSESWLKTLLWGLFIPFRDMATLLIETFTRHDFGERYYRFAAVVRWVIVLWFFPALHVFWWALPHNQIARSFDSFLSPNAAPPEDPNFTLAYATWAPFLLLVLFVANRHRKHMKRSPSVFDFARYSLSRGSRHAFFHRFDIFGKSDNPRAMACWIEPLPFLVAGIILAAIGQYLGWLLIISSIAYSIGYQVDYASGDNAVMDMIDQLISSEEMADSFLHDADPSETRGYEFMGRKPADPDKREKVYASFINEDDDAPVAG